MSTKGKTQLIIIFIAPPELVEEGDKLFAWHAEWIEKTHPKEGELALLRYNIIKAPELTLPFDSSSEPTGNTMFVLDEMYESQAGLDNHWNQAPYWEHHAALWQWANKCKVITAHNGKAVQALW
ncbi:MAG: hypothetical protein ACERKJ_12035 [Candidatus Dadabacteria bacterium]